MYDRPAISTLHAAPAAARAAQPGRRLALGLVVSAALHGLWLGLAHPPALPRLMPDTAAPTPAPLTLTLAAPVPRGAAPAAVAPSAALPASVPRSVVPAAVAPSVPAPVPRPRPGTAPARERPAQAAGPERERQALPPGPPVPRAANPAGAAAAPQPASDAGPVLPAPDAPAGAPQPSGAAILAAARHDAAAIARDLNHAPGSKAEFRSRAQEELDRRFDAAHAAGGSWFRSARVEEITTAADGSRRVYRIVTPLGTFCRTYYGDGSRPMNTTCPR